MKSFGDTILFVAREGHPVAAGEKQGALLPRGFGISCKTRYLFSHHLDVNKLHGVM